MGRLHQWIPKGLSAFFKLTHPGPVTTALESLGLTHTFANALTAGVTAMELYVGVLLLVLFDLRTTLRISTGKVLMFAGYLFLFYLSTLANFSRGKPVFASTRCVNPNFN
jgi:threonine/homoserine/homoserine lactone efflux protein